MVSIIIVNYFVKKKLFSCLQSIYDSKPKIGFEIIVVDNDEKKTIEKDLKKRFPKVRYVNNNNKGFGQGNNVGAYHAKGEYLFFLNPDTTVAKDTIDLLKKYLDTHKETGIVAPLLFNTESKIVRLQGARELTPIRAVFSFSFISKFAPNNPVTKKYWYLTEWDKKSAKEVESIPGTAFVIRREIYEKIAGFDENFFLYFEEHDLCKRVIKLGWKIVMVPQARVVHSLGESTKQMENSIRTKIFQQSRMYYLKKHFGILQAMFAELLLRTNKYTFFLGILLALGLFLRSIHIDRAMTFIGDQGWFYLSARDMLLSGNIPLVGIASSHPWLHQGAFWTYLLAPALLLFNFNPVGGAYLSILIGLCGIYAIYQLGSIMFSKTVGIVAATLLATSPLVVAFDRMPYHTSPIPLFTILALYCLFQWIKGKRVYMPLLVFVLTILYNFELATSLLSIAILGLWIYGLLKKKFWAKGIFTVNIFVLSLIAFIIPMLPMILYDIGHGFPQTLKLSVWIVYRILVLFGYPVLHPTEHVSFGTMISFFTEGNKQLIFSSNVFIAGALFITGLFFTWFQMFKNNKKSGYTVLVYITFFLIAGLFVIKTPSNAYLPMLFPEIILLVSVLFDGLLEDNKKIVKMIGIIGLLCLVIFNNVTILRTANLDTSYAQRVSIANAIVKQAREKEYTIKGKGTGSQFESFAMNYEYLTWWLGHGSSKSNQALKFIIEEKPSGIFVTKEEGKHL